MKSYQLFNWQTRPRLVDVAQPQAGPNQVLVKVGGNGLCHSDLHAVDDLTGSPPHLDIELPMTLGHEVAGWVEALGPGVGGLDIGQPCAITIAGCGQCTLCAQGWNNYCRNRGKQVGMGLDGGLSEYVAAPVGAIVPLRSLAPWQAAPLTDAGLSSYHAVKRVLPLLTPGSSVVVIGVGGGSIDFSPHGLPYGACISSSFGGSKLELMELLALAEAGQVACRIERHPLSQVDDVFDKLRRDEILGRAVVVPDGH